MEEDGTHSPWHLDAGLTRRPNDRYAKWMLDDPRINFAISTARQRSRHGSPRFPSQQELGRVRRERRTADAHRFTVCDGAERSSARIGRAAQ